MIGLLPVDCQGEAFGVFSHTPGTIVNPLDLARNALLRLASEMGYRNPTLTEILVELYLPEGTLPDKKFMALARELAALGLNDQELGHNALVVNQEPGEDPVPKVVPRIRCWDSERIRLVQFSPDALYAKGH